MAVSPLSHAQTTPRRRIPFNASVIHTHCPHHPQAGEQFVPCEMSGSGQVHPRYRPHPSQARSPGSLAVYSHAWPTMSGQCSVTPHPQVMLSRRGMPLASRRSIILCSAPGQGMRSRAVT